MNQIILHHFLNPHHQQKYDDADVVGQVGFPGAGPYMVLSLQLKGRSIEAAYFETYGCPNAIACGSWLTQWLTGKTLEQASVIEPKELGQVLGGLPLGKEHCAELAVGALRNALQQCPAEH